MQLDRIDLADIHAPDRLARAVHQQIGQLISPVPVTRIATALDIAEIRIDAFDGFEGMLLTDRVRSRGVILASKRHGEQRARFTVAHELGHFLMERHVFSDQGGFRCGTKDLRETRSEKGHQRQETEANQFAIELLAPPRLVISNLSGEPDLRDALQLRRCLDLSLEACVRRMIDLRDELLAAVWSQDGRVRYLVRNAVFPYISLDAGTQIPKMTQASQVIANAQPGVSIFAETHPRAWTNRADIELYEQTRLASNGHAVTLLWADLPEAPDDDAGVAELGWPTFR